MYNSVLIIGRTTDVPEVRKLESGLVVGNLTLAVNRPFRNTDGETDTDFINCVLWNAVALSANEFCKKGSLIAIKGYLACKDDTVVFKTDDNEQLKKRIKSMEVVVEKVMFLKL